MSAYDVPVSLLDCGCCYQVLLPDGRVAKVAPGQLGGFVGCSDGVEPDGPGFDTVDEAIRSLIGAPQ